MKHNNRMDGGEDCHHSQKIDQTGGAGPTGANHKPARLLGGICTTSCNRHTMDYLVKDETLELKYAPGKGAWTYYIQLPDTKHIVGKWGSLKVTGYIDDYKIDSVNLFTRKGQDKLISVNEKIRKAIAKTAGDTVRVTLSFVTTKNLLTEKEILEVFKDAAVLEKFQQRNNGKQQAILQTILVQPTEEMQIKLIVQQIDKLTRQQH